MISSRRRFKEFRQKLKQGLLKGDRLIDPEVKLDPPPDIGGRHSAFSGEKHIYKFSKGRLLSEYRLMLRGYYSSVAILIGVVLITSLAAMVPPYILKLLIDDVFRGRPLPLAVMLHHYSFGQWLGKTPLHGLLFLTLVLITAEVVSIGASWARMLATQRLNFRLSATLRQRLHNHLATLPLAQLADYRTGGIISRIMSDTDQVVGGVQNAIINPTSSSFRVLLILAILIATDWKLFLVALAFIPPVIAIHFWLFKRLRPMWRNIQDDRSVLAARVSDMFAGIRVVRSFRRERSEQKEFGARQNTMVRKQYYTSVLGRLLATGWSVFVPAIGIVIIWYGGQLVLKHQLSIGDLVMFETYSLMLLGPITQMIESLQNLQQNMGALDRVCDVLSQTPDMPDSPNARPIQHCRGELELRHVSFGYTDGQTILHDINLHVPANSTLAIVGPSGSGKTTLVNLVARFFDVRSGAILLDGMDIREIRRQDYRRLFAMVLQDIYLFDGNVLDNIAFGRKHASPEEIMDAARKANAHDFIMNLEKGYQTQIGERGAKLSGGEKQRISIARAILANPQILILDEATSQLDTRSERLIQHSLEDLMADRTTLVIAHRFSTIMNADSIAVLSEGKVVEQGTHQELLDQRGMYYLMFTQQFQQHRDPALERIEWEALENK